MGFSKVKSIQEDGIEDVYCMSVPECGNFYANGILVKNCDAMRYALYTHYGKKTTLKTTTREQSYISSEQKKWNQNPMAYPGFVNSPGWQKY